MHELIRAEFVGIIAMAGWGLFAFSAIPEVGPSRSFVGWPDAATPVIAVRKTAPRKPNYRSFDLAHFIDKFLANAINIRNLRVGPDPNAIVDHTAKVLGEVSIEIRRNNPQGLAGEHFDARVHGFGFRPGKGEGSSSGN